MNDLHTRRRLNPWLGWALALAVMAAFASLGFWQLSRSQQKQAMLGDVAQVLSAREAAPLAAVTDAARAKRYDWAAGRGQFVEAPAVLLDNQLREGRAGVRAYRLFQTDSGHALLVELGWLALPPDRRMPTVPRPEDEQVLRGLLLPPPSGGIAGTAVSSLADGSVLTLGLDPAVLAPQLGVQTLPPRVFRPDPQLPLGYARDLEVLPNTLTPEKHLGYAVQWFGLALTVLITALLLSLRQYRRGREKMAE